MVQVEQQGGSRQHGEGAEGSEAAGLWVGAGPVVA